MSRDVSDISGYKSIGLNLSIYHKHFQQTEIFQEHFYNN
jgi:hypothetical protein